MGAVTITTAGVERLAASYASRAARLRGPEMRTILQELGKALKQAYVENVASFTPGTVRDLKPATKKEKQRLVGAVYPILVRTGAMLASGYSRVEITSSGWLVRVDFAGTHPGGGITNKRLAQLHIEGTARLPARDFTKLPPGFMTPWLRRIQELVTGRRGAQ